MPPPVTARTSDAQKSHERHACSLARPVRCQAGFTCLPMTEPTADVRAELAEALQAAEAAEAEALAEAARARAGRTTA